MRRATKVVGTVTGRFTSSVPNFEELDKRTGFPAFLIISQAKRDENWRRNPPKPMPLLQLRIDPAIDPAVITEFKQAKKVRSLGKLKAWQREGSVKRDAKGVLRNDKGVPVRWNPLRSRFEPERQFTKSVTQIVNDAILSTGKTTREPKSVPVNDDIVHQIKDRYGMDVGKLKKFAKSNGVWDDKYASLPNPGLVRMNVVNRLRAKVRKGHQVVW